MYSLKPLVIVCSVILLSSCSSTGRSATQPEYEVVTVEEQALAAVRGTDTKFQVSGMDDPAFWTRARLFLEKYTDPASLTVESMDPDGLRYSNRRSQSDRFFYQIEKYPSSTGYTYLIKCDPRGAQQNDAVSKGIMNAKNLSRFIREGYLELSLLNR